MTSPSAGPSLRPAAQYLRMSKEHQRYSPKNQAAALAVYAAAHGYEIIRTYSDLGVSGVSTRGRRGLQALLADVLEGAPGFETILVYDVSRWGRFQNPDESAHYEFICKQAGVSVVYCAETFDNDGSLAGSILKTVRRVMAAEYSRDLSTKIRQTRRRALEDGFWLGGNAGYGLRRQIVKPDGSLGAVLNYGEQRAIAGHRTRIVLGAPHERAVVRRIYRRFVAGGTIEGIARALNAERICSETGRPWSRQMLLQILTHPKYIGVRRTGRYATALGAGSVRTSPEAWADRPRAHPAIVSRHLFDEAQAIFAARTKPMARDEMLEIARAAYAQHGRLTWTILEAIPHKAPHAAYRRAFGNLNAVRIAVGCPVKHPPRTPMVLAPEEALRRLADVYRRVGYLSRAVINAQPDLPDANYFARRFGGMHGTYALVGFVPLNNAARASPVGRARIAAALALSARRAARPPAPEEP